MKIYFYQFPRASFYTRTYLKDDAIVTACFSYYELSEADKQANPTYNYISEDQKDAFLQFLTENYTQRPTSNYYYYFVDPSYLGKDLTPDDPERTPYLRLQQVNTLFLDQLREDFAEYVISQYSYSDQFTGLESILGESYNTKIGFKNWLTTQKKMPIWELYCPSSQTPIYDDSNVLIVSAIARCPSDVIDMRSDAEAFTSENISDLPEIIRIAKQAFPKAKVTVPSQVFQGDVVQVDVEIRKKADDNFFPTGELFTKPLKLKAQTTAGYLPVNQIMTDTGKATFYVHTDNVPIGTTVKFKVSTDLFTNIGCEVFTVA